MKLLLQSFTPYDKSIKWDIHYNFYLKRGAKAWLKGEVPYDITSNSYAAYQNAMMVYRAVKDMDKKNHLGTDEKINVMELASGVGLFSINFIQQFERICNDNKVDYFKRFQYFFSDFSEKNLQEAAKNVFMKDLEKKGKLVFVVVDAVDPTKIRKLGNNEMIADIKFVGIIANYTHDCLPLTILRKRDSVFYEKYIALSIETDEVPEDKINDYKKELINNPINKEIMDKLIEEEKYEPIDHTTLDPVHKEIMDEATKNLPVATIVYPYGSFRAIKEALPLLKKGGLYLISDKGYASVYYMEGERLCAPSTHGNTLAHSVNFPLIELYAQKIGLFSTRTSNPDYGLQTIVLMNENNKSIKEVFNELFVDNNLNHESSQLRSIVDILDKEKKFQEAILILKQVLKIRQYDANIYSLMGRFLLREDKADDAITYFVEGQKYNYFNLFDFEFELGLAYYRLGKDKISIGHYKDSIKLFGPSEYVYNNIGLCYESLKNYQSAKKYYLKALRIDNKYENAKNNLIDMILKLESPSK